MIPESLDPLFHSLPRERASELFTERVMARVRTHAAPAPRLRRSVLAIASVFLAAIALASVASFRRAERQDAVEAARAEQMRIERELEQIKEMTAGLQPVVYVGSTGDYDYYIDLRALQEESAVVQPASYREAPRPGI